VSLLNDSWFLLVELMEEGESCFFPDCNKKISYYDIRKKLKKFKNKKFAVKRIKNGVIFWLVKK